MPPDLSDAAFQRWLSESLADPVLFCQRILRDDPWQVETELMRAIDKPRARVAIKGCHSSGKTYTLAQLTLWFIARYRDGIVITTAPTDRQVEKVMWMQIHQARGRSRIPFPNATLTQIRIDADNYATGFSTSKSDGGVRFHGFKAPHMLFVLDEAPGIPAEVMTALSGSAAGGDVRIVMLGNPTIPSGPFYDAFTKDRELWQTFTIDVFDTPNFDRLREIAEERYVGLSEGEKKSYPTAKDYIVRLLQDLPLEHLAMQYNPRSYLAAPVWAREKLIEWGVVSPMWQAKVRGQFPDQAENALIGIKWLEAAREPVVFEGDEAELYCGIDVAAGGGDESVCVVRTKRGRIVTQQSWSGYSTGPVINFLTPYKERLREINFDRAGPGEYFDTALAAAGFMNLVGVNVGESTDFPDRFRNLKAQLYWSLRETFHAGGVSGLKDDLTISQLASIQYEINPRGLIEIESKDSMAKRGLKSPDRAEAIMLAFANRTPGLLEYYRQQVESLQPASKEPGRLIVNTETKAVEIVPAKAEPKVEEPKTRNLMDIYLNVGKKPDLCAVCGKEMGKGEQRITDGLDIWHVECYAKR